jgi:TRAP-type mannitol/chloroaromatic compound transport system substrate-binding protein
MNSRRNFIATTAKTAAAVAAVGTTGSAMAQTAPIKMVIQSAFPKNEMFHSFCELYAKKVMEMSGGRLDVELIASGKGAKVKAFDILDATSEGKIDAGIGNPSYWTDKAEVAGLWDTGATYGMNSELMMAWHKHGGGQQLRDEMYKSVGSSVKSILFMPMPSQPLGWFKNSISSLKEIKGLRYRTTGLSGKIFEKLGAKVMSTPGGEILDAFRTGKVDAAEFNNTTSDQQLGLNTVVSICMLQSFHQASGMMEVLFNNKFMEKLTPDLRQILEIAAECVSSDGTLRQLDLNAKSYDELSRTGTQFLKTPSALLQAQLNAWDEVVAEMSAKNPLASKIVTSQRTYAEMILPWKEDVEVDYTMAYDHYWTRRG